MNREYWYRWGMTCRSLPSAKQRAVQGRMYFRRFGR